LNTAASGDGAAFRRFLYSSLLSSSSSIDSHGIDGNIEVESMSENLAEGLHVIWKHWQGHFDKSLKYYTKIGQIEDPEVGEDENLS